MTSAAPHRPRHVDWSEPALPAVARALADEHAGSETLDLSSLVLAFPGGRPARRMTELLVDEADRRGLALAPPDTVTVGSLPEMLYRPERPLADGLLLRRLWARALRETPGSQLEALLPDPPAASDRAAWAGLAREVQRLYREVGREGLDFGDVAEACGAGALLFDDSTRWRVLARVEERYRLALEEVGREDPDRARKRALEQGEVSLYHLYRHKSYTAEEQEGADGADGRDGGRGGRGAPAPAVHLVGIPEMPGVLRRMLRAVAGGGTPVVPWIHAPAERSEAFDDLGCVVPEAWREARVPVPDEALAFRNGPAEEAWEALRAVADFAPHRTPEGVTVGVADDGLVPWLEQRFEAYGVPHRSAAGTPLERTAPYRLLAACADWLDGRRFPDLADLLRHPDLERALHADRPLETADAYFSEHLPARIPEEPTGASAEAARMRKLVKELDGDGLLEPLRGPERPLREWMPPVLGLLERAYGPGPLNRAVPAEWRIVEACRRIRDAAAGFHDLPPEADEPVGAGAAIRLLLAEARQSPAAAIPPEADRSAVEILGWLELHLDDAPDLVLTGANEPRLPESVNADLFLPNRLRRELGLQDNEARYARDAYLLTAVLAARERVRIVAARRDADGNPLRPSRLLMAGRPEAMARRLLRFLGDEDGAPVRPASPLGLEAAGEGGFRVPPEPRIRLTRVPESFRVTDFRGLLADPYRWILERHLGLEELDDRARELDPLAFGSLAHEVLERFGRAEERHATEGDVVFRRLERILADVVRARFGSSLPSVPVQVEQLRTRLRAFARWHAGWIAAGWRIAATEARPAEGVPFEVEGGTVRLRGRIDRIDVHERRGEVAVFDYKTGDSAADPERAHRSRSGEWRDLQLPLYRHLLPHVVDPEGRPVWDDEWRRRVEAAAGERRASSGGGGPPGGGTHGGAALRLGYIRLPKEEAGVGHAFLGWGEDVLRAADDQARRLVRRLREEGAVEFDPERFRTNRWDALGTLLGRDVLAPAKGSVEDREDEDREDEDGEEDDG